MATVQKGLLLALLASVSLAHCAAQKIEIGPDLRVFIGSQAAPVFVSAVSNNPVSNKAGEYVGKDNVDAVTAAGLAGVALVAHNHKVSPELAAQAFGAFAATAVTSSTVYDKAVSYIPVVGGTLQSKEGKQFVNAVLAFVVINGSASLCKQAENKPAAV